MTKLFDQALATVSKLPPHEQDEIARIILGLAGSDTGEILPLSAAEQAAIARSKAAASRGEFATEEQVRAAWAKHGL